MKSEGLLKILLLVLLFSTIFYCLVSVNGLMNNPHYNSDYHISIKSRNFTPEEGVSDNIKFKIKSSFEKTHVYIQFYGLPNYAERKILQNKGIKLLSYIPNQAWFASISQKNIDEVLKLPNVRSITEILPKDKLSPQIRNNGLNNYSLDKNRNAKLFVRFFDDVPIKRSLKIINDHNGIVLDSLNNDYLILIPEYHIDDLSNEDSVKWIDQYYKYSLDNDGSRGSIGVNSVQTIPYNLSGKGIIVGEWDGGCVDNQHYDLIGRVIQRSCNGTEPDHATHVAGTMLGNGNRSQTLGGSPLQWRGMAPNALVVSYLTWNSNIFQANRDYDEAINIYNISLSTNSWGFGSSGTYNYANEKEDNIVRGQLGKKISIMRSAGNNGPNWETLRDTAAAKNIIAVGAIDTIDNSICSFSSAGPSSDGRVKPDLVAVGCKNQSFLSNYSDPIKSIWSTVPGNNYTGMSGTSMSTPAVSGSVALVLEEWKRLLNQDPLPSTVKAILIETAEDLGNTGPDYKSGYGKINVTKAVNLISDYNNSDIKESLIGEDEIDSYKFNVNQSDNEIKLTLVWDDFPGDSSLQYALVNDLDLIVISPSGARFYPWTLDPNNPNNPAVRNQSDHINNVEQVYINTSDYGNLNGTWIIQINGTQILESEQSYSISTNGKILYSLDPIITQIQCKNSSSWVNCSQILKGNNLTQVRVNCSSNTNTIIGAHFKLINFRDNVTFFDNFYTSNDSNGWIYDNNDIIINNTGDFSLIVNCFDSANYSEIDYNNWHVPVPGEDSCGILDEEGQTYTLIQDVTSSGTCFNVTANNITIDGEWYTVSYAKNQSGYGIYNSAFNFTRIEFLEIKMENTTIQNSPGIFIQESNNNDIEFVYLNISGTTMQDSFNYGIELKNTKNSHISFSQILTNSQRAYGIYIFSTVNKNSDNNLIGDTEITTTSGYSEGIFSWGSNGGTVNNLSLINNQVNTLNTYSYGIHLKDGSNAVVDNNYINTSLSYGILIESSNSNLIQNSNINSSNNYDVNVISGTNNTFLNSTYTDESVSGSLVRKWYLNAQVKYSNGTIANQANVSGYNVSGSQQFSELTDSSGLISTKELIEYINNGTIKMYYTNYTINATKNNLTDSKLINLTTNTNLFLSLTTQTSDNVYPQFFNYWDNNGTLIGSGIAKFNISVNNSNGTVILSINGANYSASNITSNVFNVSVNLNSGNFNYYWISFGNGINHNYNSSIARNYTVNSSVIGVNSCGTLSNASTTYTLTSNIINNTLTTNCITISAQNITFDCAGYSITSMQNVTGIYTNQLNSIIKNCNVTMGGTTGLSNGAVAIQATSGSNGTLILNNTARSQVGFGIYINGAYQVNVINNSAYTDSNYGISDSGKYNLFINNFAYALLFAGTSVGESGQYNNWTNNVANGTAGVGFYIIGNNNYFYNITGFNNGSSNFGIYLGNNGNNNTFYNIKALSPNSGGIGLRFRAAQNNTFYNCVNITGGSYDVLTVSLSPFSPNNVLVNCSYRNSGSYETVGVNDSIIRKWWYVANATDTNNNPVVANIIAMNKTGGIEFNFITNSNGLTNLIPITEYANSNGVRSYYSNYTINATNNSYSPSLVSHSLNITGNNYNDIFIFSPTVSDNIYPQFSSYWDNNGTLVGSGVALFNVTVQNTNGTVMLNINGQILKASNISSNVYNASLNLNNGTYSYNWTAYGNGTNHNLNNSLTRSYTVNTTSGTSVSGCGTLGTAGSTYILTTNIINNSISNDCIIISAQNITLDCQGYSISSIKNYSGIYSNQRYTTIKNCNISIGSGGDANSFGIELFAGANYSLLLNNNILGDSRAGIELSGVYYSNVTNNNASSTSRYGIYLLNSNNNYLYNNIGNGVGSSSSGIILSGSKYNHLMNNIGNSTSGVGISIESSSNNNTLFGNTGISSASNGINIFLSSYNNLTNNYGTSSSGAGIRFNSATYNILLNNQGNSSSYYGHVALSSSQNNTVINSYFYSKSSNAINLASPTFNNTYINTIGYSNSSTAIYLSTTNYNNFINCSGFSNTVSGVNVGLWIENSTNTLIQGVILNGSYALRFRGARNNIIRDCVSIISTNSDVYTDNLSYMNSTNNTMINCSYSLAKESVSLGNDLKRKWYLEVNVTNSTGVALSGALVNSSNSSLQLQVSSLTDANGQARQELIEYVNFGGTRSYYSLYSVNISKSGFSNLGNSSINMSTNQKMNVNMI